MKIINGAYSSAHIFTTTNETTAIDPYAVAQIQMICDHESSLGSTIRVMPDVHPGKVGTIGLTMTIGEKIMPNLIGIDIGCGMTLARIKGRKIEYQKLDTVIRENIPSSFHIRNTVHRLAEDFDFGRLRCAGHIRTDKAFLSLGSLGGGNHFTLSAFKSEMKGIYSSCISKDTLDEAPFAYRRMEEIAEVIRDTVTIDTILRPVYNYKAGNDSKIGGI